VGGTDRRTETSADSDSETENETENKTETFRYGGDVRYFPSIFFAQKHKKKETHSIRNERLNSKTVSGKWLTVKSSARNLCVVVFLEN